MAIYSTGPTDPVTPTAYKRAKKRARESWAAYVAARRAVLPMIRTWRHACVVLSGRIPSTDLEGQLREARRIAADAENAMDDMWTARRYAYSDLQTVASYERRGVVKGCAMCPAAQKRARRAGRLL